MPLTDRPWTERPDHLAWLRDQLRRQLAFGAGFAAPGGGAGWLDDQGRPDPSRPVHTWITARMAHVYSLGAIAGVPGCGPLADVALDGLTGRLEDHEHGGWLSSVGPDGERDETLGSSPTSASEEDDETLGSSPTSASEEDDETKSAYTHAFVLLAAATATTAARPGAPDLLERAATTLDERFLTPAGLYAEHWDRTWTRLDPYRGVNANMHAVEACLSAYDATGRASFLARAAHVADQVVAWASANNWRVPEHFDEDWQPLPDHHRDQPDHPFEPFGATVGHGLEWSRVLVTLGAADGVDRTPAAVALFARAVEDGWAVDGADGFVYTTDWDGRPVVRERMHWVVCEAISAAAALHEATGDARYDEWYRTWWDHAARHWIDPATGSWAHQRAPDLSPSDSVWAGRPDLYHSVHAVLLPRLPLWPAPATSLQERS